MRRHVLWRLIWIQTVCKCLQNSVPALKELKDFIPLSLPVPTLATRTFVAIHVCG
ncbi:hypothetical protein DPMN_188312 [Dreissena polymorpha]|uniref:Uncharacterized protein n=1 Tax=Dreissena polymorpha TaxID=45954 RepID=A0A9D4I9T8_DREPO|nr:hypothetical protein DPMN_188312 [Dreissena polymorpha]